MNTKNTPQALNGNDDSAIEKIFCCSQCGREGLDPRFSKYRVDKIYHEADTYICDHCPSIFVVYDLGENRYYRQELSRCLLNNANDIPY